MGILNVSQRDRGRCEIEERSGRIERIRRGTRDRWLYNIMNSTQLESEYGDCPDCGRENIEFKIWKLGDGSIKRLKYCPDCTAKSQQKIKEQEESARKLAVAAKRREWRENCGIPMKFMNEQFDTFDKSRQKDKYELCLEYADSYPLMDSRKYPSLVLYSESSWGVGKTHLACSIGHHILNRWDGENIGRPVLFISEPDLYLRIQATYNYSTEERHYRESETDIINQLTSVPLLIMDDLGKRKTHDPRFVQRIMFAVIDGRYKDMRPMVLTANLSPQKLAFYLGGGEGDEASFDRLLEMCGGAFVRIEGESFRREIK